MSASGIIGTFQGPRSPGTAYVLLHHYMGEIDGAFRAWGVPRGGTGARRRRDRAAPRSPRASRSAPRRRSRASKTSGGRATGVMLQSGEEIDAGVVMSSLDSRQTFINLLEDGVLDPTFREEVLRYKYRGLQRQGEPRARAACPSWRASRAWGSGSAARSRSARRSTTWSAPTTTRSTAGPPSAPTSTASCRRWWTRPWRLPAGHVMSCFVQYAPYHLENGEPWDDAKREAFGQNVIDTLEERFPDIRSKIVGHQFITPKDIEDITGLSEGNIFAGELSLEQLFFNRPVPGWARYRTPVKDLWMCGSATHPGGGIMGAPGRIAALGVPQGEEARTEGGLMAKGNDRRHRRRATTASSPPRTSRRRDRRSRCSRTRTRSAGILRNSEVAPGIHRAGHRAHGRPAPRPRSSKDLKLESHGLEHRSRPTCGCSPRSPTGTP